MIKLDKVVQVLKTKNLAPAVLKNIVEELQKIEETKPDKPITDKVKKQWVVVAYDPDNKLAALDVFAFVAQIDAAEKPDAILGYVAAARNSYNLTKKGKKFPVKNLAEAFDRIPRKFTKEAGYLPKNKDAIVVVKTQ
jgi:hypothetical protein